MHIVFNPGTEPVENATLDNAMKNIAKLIEDINETPVFVTRVASLDHGGRYGFKLIFRDEGVTEVEMPGLPLDQVRWIDVETQDPWDFPRMYIDGHSWLWKFAISVINDRNESED